jgi:hypothetical protein
MYATVEHLQARMPQFQLTATSRPTQAESQVFLDDVEAEFNVAVETLGIRTPVTGTKSIQIARTIVIFGAIARVLYARAAAVGGDAAMQSAKAHQALYDQYLKNLADPKNPLELTDATRTGGFRDKPQAFPRALWLEPVIDDDTDPGWPRVTMRQQF